MSEVAESPRFISAKLGDVGWPISKNGLGAKAYLSWDNDDLHDLSNSVYQDYSGEDVSTIFKPTTRLKNRGSDLMIELEYSSEVKKFKKTATTIKSVVTLQVKYAYLFYQYKSDRVYWLQPLDIYVAANGSKHQLKDMATNQVVLGRDEMFSYYFKADKLPATTEIDPFVIKDSQEFYEQQQASEPQAYYQCILLTAQKN